MENITAIIQSSWNSKILAYKSLIRLANGKTVLELIVDSLRRINSVGDILLATSTAPEDEKIAEEAKRLGISCFRGAVKNVLERLQFALAPFSGHALKVDGNKPLFGPFEAEKLIESHFSDGCDYSYNGHYRGVVYGTDCEVVNIHALRSIDSSSLNQDQQEAGTMYMRANPHMFRINAHNYRDPRPNYRVILENNRDLEVINTIIKSIDVVSNESIKSFLDKNPIISGYNHVECRKEVGLNKIMLFPDKIGAIQKVGPGHPDLTYPISVELSYTNRCNFNCIWCSDKDLRQSQNGDLSLETIERLADDLALGGTQGVTVEGGGEPTLVKYFDEAARIFRSKGLALGLITNGSVRLKEETVDAFDWIRVSLDASCQTEMQILKGYKDYENVLGNIFHYAKRKPIVGVGYVATNQNISKIESLVLRLRETQVNYIQIRPVIDYPDLLPNYNFEYLKKYQTETFSVITDGMKQNLIKGNHNIPCTSHSISTVITADGSVYICGRLNIYPWLKPIGNINEQSFYDIWNGEERRRQSDMVLENGFCAENCPACRITKFNLEFEHLKQIQTKNFI